MTFLPEELGLINYALKDKIDIKPEDQKEAQEVLSKLMASTVPLEEGSERRKYVEAEVEFATKEKVFILGLIERPWSVGDGKYYLSLKEKLS